MEDHLQCETENGGGKENDPFAAVGAEYVYDQVRQAKQDEYDNDLSCLEAKIEAKQAGKYVLIFCQHGADGIGKAHSVNEAEEQGDEIVDTDRPGREFFLEQVTDGGDDDGAGYQKFHPVAIEPDYVHHAQCEGE